MKNKFLQLSAIAVFVLTTFTSHAQSWSLTGNSGTSPATNFIGTKDNKAFVFRTNNIEQVRINNIGYIGIGIKNPEARLHVNNGAFVNLSSPGCFQIGPTNAYNIGMDYSAIQARYKGTASRLYLNYFGGDVWIGAHNANPVPAIYVAADGGVGIGSDYVYSLYTLTVNSNSSSPFGNIYSVNNESGDCMYAFAAHGTGVYTVANDNNGLYALTNNSGSYYAGYFVGDVYCSGTYSGSDEKLKQNIQDVTSAMDVINQLKPKKYNYRQDGDYKLMNLPQGNHYGLIAQDVEKILPNLVKNSKADISRSVPFKTSELKNQNRQNSKDSAVINFKALNYTELIPIIIKGMQEMNKNLQQQLQEQQQRINRLEKVIEKLSGNSNESSSNISPEKSSAYLKQNTPNPFTQNTIIYCNVPSSAMHAELIIYTAKGSRIKSYALTNGINNVTINEGMLSSGDYVYSLMIDGRKIDSKKMVSIK